MIKIRQGTKEDNEILFDLIKELAQFEKKKPDEIQLTLERIAAHHSIYFETLLAYYEQNPVGYALYFYTYSASEGAPILYLEDLFVKEDYRHLGLGKALFKKLAYDAKEKNCCRMEWHAFTWNENAIQFYKKLNAQSKKDLLQFRLTRDEIIHLTENEVIM